MGLSNPSGASGWENIFCRLRPESLGTTRATEIVGFAGVLDRVSGGGRVDRHPTHRIFDGGG
jgi:hypothetical protein